MQRGAHAHGSFDRNFLEDLGGFGPCLKLDAEDILPAWPTVGDCEEKTPFAGHWNPKNEGESLGRRVATNPEVRN